MLKLSTAFFCACFLFLSVNAASQTIKQDSSNKHRDTVEKWVEYSYNEKWFIVATNYEAYSRVFGFSISNGFDEVPLIHFEDISDNVLYKISGQTDFNKNYAFDMNLTESNGRYYIPTLQYIQRNYIANNFSQKNINLTIETSARFINCTLQSRVGYNYLNGKENMGLGIGLQADLYPRFYFGFIGGDYFKYRTYDAWLQAWIINHKLGARVAYSMVNNQNFLTAGLHFAFYKMTQKPIPG